MKKIQQGDPLFQAILKSELFHVISPSDHKSAFKDLGITIKEYNEEEIIFSEEEEVKRLGIIQKGSIRGEKFYIEGDVHLMHMYQEGDMFAVEAAASQSGLAPLTYIANEDTKVLFVSVSRMLQSKFAVELMQGVMHILADDSIRKLYKIETLAKRKLRERIMVHFRILEKKAGGSTFHLRMDQEQFAQYLCVNRSALSNELNKMRKDGLIDFIKDQVTIL